MVRAGNSASMCLGDIGRVSRVGVAATRQASHSDIREKIQTGSLFGVAESDYTTRLNFLREFFGREEASHDGRRVWLSCDCEKTSTFRRQ